MYISQLKICFLFGEGKGYCHFRMCNAYLRQHSIKCPKKKKGANNLYLSSSLLIIELFRLNEVCQGITMVMMALPRCGAWYSGIISMKQVSLNDVRRHIFAENYIKNKKLYWTFWQYYTTNDTILTINKKKPQVCQENMLY